jgi:AcrR family transcriptional regulator
MSKQPRAEETHRRILDAALDAFARQGYDATGVAEICQRAGVTKGGFYHHFHSKQDVFLELLERWLVGIDTQMTAARAGARTVPEALLIMTGMIQRIFQEAGGSLPLFLEFMTQAAHSPVFFQATAVPIRRYLALFADMMAAGAAEGSMRPVEPEIAGRVLVAFAMGLLVMGLVDPLSADWGEVAREGVQLFLAGLAPE